jgi:hypothetical protein
MYRNDQRMRVYTNERQQELNKYCVHHIVHATEPDQLEIPRRDGK